MKKLILVVLILVMSSAGYSDTCGCTSNKRLEIKVDHKYRVRASGICYILIVTDISKHVSKQPGIAPFVGLVFYQSGEVSWASYYRSGQYFPDRPSDMDLVDEITQK